VDQNRGPFHIQSWVLQPHQIRALSAVLKLQVLISCALLTLASLFAFGEEGFFPLAMLHARLAAFCSHQSVLYVFT
jgi:hypothetical protein